MPGIPDAITGSTFVIFALVLSLLVVPSESQVQSPVKCFICKTDKNVPAGLVGLCPDVSDASTTAVETCASGVCLVFVGSQEWRGQTLNGIIRICVTQKVMNVLLPPNWTIPSSRDPVCLDVDQKTTHNQSNPTDPCNEVVQHGILSLVGRACVCAGDLCNTSGNNSSNLTGKSTYFPAILTVISFMLIQLFFN